MIYPIEKIKQLETELSDLKAQFAEYVKAEDDWRGDLTYRREGLRLVARNLREKAKQTLGL